MANCLWETSTWCTVTTTAQPARRPKPRARPRRIPRRRAGSIRRQTYFLNSLTLFYFLLFIWAMCAHVSQHYSVLMIHIQFASCLITNTPVHVQLDCWIYYVRKK
ncbi:hypothetical protein QQG55_2060 [Brugia pahangi]